MYYFQDISVSLVELYWGKYPLIIIVIHLQTFIHLIAFYYCIYKWNPVTIIVTIIVSSLALNY